MHFVSTRGQSPPVGFSDAFAAGLAPDGGLYVPASLPPLPNGLLAEGETGSNVTLAYPKLAYEFLRLFDTDHSPGDLRALVEHSHENFDDPVNPAPLRQLAENLFVLELFHGPTLAFKDFGLQLVGNLFEDQIRRTGKPINVLGATSGDTGSAAIHGLAGKEGVHVFILYPKGRISELQERQMTCTGAGNIYPIAIEGSFDDAQHIVKHLFGELEFKERAGLSAVNSINIARILAQSVYYIHAFNQLPADARQNLNFITPTGNFGNVFAGWLAHKMGLPVAQFVVATNQNDILYRLFQSGSYEMHAVKASLAPSMDIQAASNFERFLYYMLDQEPEKVVATMHALGGEGSHAIGGFDRDIFAASHSTDADILKHIQDVHEKYDYIVDPHTACGFAECMTSAGEARSESGSSSLPAEASREGRVTLVLATAHPAKFPDTIETAIGIRPTHPALEALMARTPVSHEVEPTPEAVRRFIEDNAAGRAPRG